jgi:hypothetical protein
MGQEVKRYPLFLQAYQKKSDKNWTFQLTARPLRNLETAYSAAGGKASRWFDPLPLFSCDFSVLFLKKLRGN